MDTLNQFIQRMLQDLQLRGMSQPTLDNYTRSVRKLVEHYHKLPDQITEEEIRNYFLYLKNVRKYGRSVSTLAMCGLRFFYTYTRTLIYHPHVHYLVPAVGGSEDGATWIKGSKKFFLPVKALSKIFRAMFRDALKENAPELFSPIPQSVWNRDWVVHCKPAGNGDSVLKYFAPYIFRVAISNRGLARWKPTRQPNRLKLSGDRFVRCADRECGL